MKDSETDASGKTLIVVYSYHHHNTEKIARAMAEELSAEVVQPQTFRPEDVSGYALAGFGAGIDSGRHYAPLLEFVEKLPRSEGRRAFLFSTCGVKGDRKMRNDHAALRNILLSKGFEIVGEFTCTGFNTNSFLKLFGGINRGKPDDGDLADARAFARSLTEKP